MKTENINISCDVCLDLIPLVCDNVASEDSIVLVNKHIEGCTSCRNEFGEKPSFQNHEIDDKKIIKSIKRSIFAIGCGVLLAGVVLGILLSNGMGMFYNFVLMPAVGILGYLIFHKRWFWVPAGMFVLSYIWLVIYNIIDSALTNGFEAWVLTGPIIVSAIYTVLVLVGIAIGMLLKFALGKNKND